MNNQTSILINENGHLRSGWRAAIFLFTFFVFSYVFIGASLAILALIPFGTSASSFLPLIAPFAISSFLALLLGWLCGKVFESLPFRALGISLGNGWIKNLVTGLGIGAVTMALAVFIVAIFGGMSVSLNRVSTTSAIFSTLQNTLLIFIAGALSEETLFRGYLLQTFSRAKVAWIGIGFTSILFGAAHLNNPDVSWFAVINTVLAGLWFSFAYLKTRDLWFPFGIHLMWNWMQGPIFGINVSGIGEFAPDPLLKTAEMGPAWLTGGNYGIEGGIGCTAAIIISIIIVHFLPGLDPTEEMLELTGEEQPSPVH